MKLKLLYKQVFYESLIKTLIEEGVYDKNIFKAVFLAGGPGSGKSFVSEKLLSGYGLKVYNVDKPTEYYMNKNGLDLKMPDDQEDARNYLRDKAKHNMEMMSKYWIDGRLGLIIDGTGKDYDKVVNRANELKSLGYDVGMVFVATSLSVALQRNSERDRTVPDKLLIQMHRDSEINEKRYKVYFNKNFFRVLNDEPIDSNSLSRDAFGQIDQDVKYFINQPVRNPLAKQWIDQQLDNKKFKID